VFNVLAPGALTSIEAQRDRLEEIGFPHLGPCRICKNPVYKVSDNKRNLPYYGSLQPLKGELYLSAIGDFVACHCDLDCMDLFKETTTGKAHFPRVSSAATSKKSSPSCESNGCTHPPTIERKLKNGSLQLWCKPCLNSYYKARDAFRSNAIAHAGGLEKAKCSIKRTDGKVLGKCMECNEHVLDSHEKMVTLAGCFVHIGCLG